MNNIDNMISSSLNSDMPAISVLSEARVAMANIQPTKRKRPLWLKMSASFASLLILCVGVLWANLVFGGANSGDNDFGPEADSEYAPGVGDTDGTIDGYQYYYASNVYSAYGVPSLVLDIDYCMVYVTDAGDVVYVCESYIDSASGIYAVLHIVDNSYLDVDIYNLHNQEGYSSVFGDDAQHQTIAGIEVAVWQSDDSYGSDIWAYGMDTEQYQWYITITAQDEAEATAIVEQWLLEMLQ